LRAAGEPETTHENSQDWLELDEGEAGLQLLTEGEITAEFIFYFCQHYLHYYIIHLFGLLSFSFVF
jgi:hypothetical protein